MASIATQVLEPADDGAVPPGHEVRAELVDWHAMDNPPARRAWEALADRASEPNPFHESWYLIPALRALQPKGRVGLLRVMADDALIGVLPVLGERRYYGRPIPHLCGWIHGNSFAGTPLVAPGMEQPFWRALLDWADHRTGHALFLHLAALPLDGPLYPALQAVVAEQGRAAGLVFREHRAMLDSALSAEDYFEASLSAKKRKELRRQSTRLAELGNVRFERLRDARGLERWIDDFLALEHSGWKGAAGSALLSHHETAQLFREALGGAARHGKLERLTLFLDGEPIAMLANFLVPPGAYSYKTAFDERYARYSPGVLIQQENLALLDDPAVQWCDSCAAADHPMIDHLWRERRPIGRVSIAIGGKLRRGLFAQMLRLELGRTRLGLDDIAPRHSDPGI